MRTVFFAQIGLRLFSQPLVSKFVKMTLKCALPSATTSVASLLKKEAHALQSMCSLHTNALAILRYVVSLKIKRNLVGRRLNLEYNLERTQLDPRDKWKW